MAAHHNVSVESYESALKMDRRGLEHTAVSQMLDGFNETKPEPNVFATKERSYLSLLSELNRSGRSRMLGKSRRRPPGVSCWSRDKEPRLKPSREDFWDVPPYVGAGVNCASSHHRNPSSIPPIGAVETVARRTKETTDRMPPPGTYSLPDLWSEPTAPRYLSRFDQQTQAMHQVALKGIEKSECHTIYGDAFRLPLSNEERSALARIRKKLKVKTGHEVISGASPQKHRNAIVLEGVNQAFGDGRDNLLIHALMREENERKQKESAPIMFQPPPAESEIENDPEFEKMFAEKTQPDPVAVTISIDKDAAIRDLM
ncbi:unnamed protein product [Amoebophrya sp. A120]|nr:unnamed protein product [Amoebophrya sp. A120]|eukprot:GSA120T00011138001.1